MWLEDRQGPSRERFVVEVEQEDVILNGSDYDSSESEPDEDDEDEDEDGGDKERENSSEDERLERIRSSAQNQPILRTGPLTSPPIPPPKQQP